jgi:membrane protein
VLGGQRGLDRLQSRHWWAGFPYAVLKKYTDDQASRQAALLTYYGFLNLFPLALVFVAVLSAVLRNNPERVQEVLDELVSPQYQQTVLSAYNAMPDSGLPLVVGVLGLLLSGMGIAFAAYMALNQFWAVPYRERYGFGPRYLRVFIALFLVGVCAFLVAAAGILTGNLSGLVWIQRLALFAVTALIGFLGIYFTAHLLTARRLTWADLWLGCLLGGLGVALVFTLGSPLLAVLIQRSTPVYGAFATVVGSLGLIYLAAQVLVISMEICVVRRWQLWPRGLDINLLFEADQRAYRILGRMDERMPSSVHTVVFDAEGNDDPERITWASLTGRGDRPRSPYQ